MTGAARGWAAELLRFWFHDLHPDQWFARNDRVDETLRRRFGRTLAMLAKRPVPEFLRDRQTARAAVLLLDQLPRNLFRDDPRAFACDRRARAITRGALAKGWNRGLGKHERHFLYMPLMHSEAITDQLLALRLFAGLGDASVFAFSRVHARMIRRFGRFPHRNALLGRRSPRAEQRAIAAGNAW